jgi:hypothetical protein
MPARTQSEICEKAAVSVSETASRCGLSRTHFHALIKNGIMPPPCYDLKTRKPFYTREILDDCLRIRRTNVAFDGSLCLFYQRRQPTIPMRRAMGSRRGAAMAVTIARHTELLEGLRVMGLATISDGHVDDALRVCYPDGVGSTSEGEVLRSLWQHLRRSQGV